MNCKLLIVLILLWAARVCSSQESAPQKIVLQPFSEQCNYMSTAGFWRHLMTSDNINWPNNGIPPGIVKHDGLYIAQGDYYKVLSYLRFYDDGTILETSASTQAGLRGTPEEVVKWLTKEPNAEQYISRSHFIQQGYTIRFFIDVPPFRNHKGDWVDKIHFVGKVGTNSIEIYSLKIDEKIHYANYAFIKLTD